jgi:hypothetical protein
MPNEWIDLLLTAARDLQVLIVILFFIGIGLFVSSIIDIPLGATKIVVKPEDRKKAFRSGTTITIISGLLLLILLFYPKNVEVYGTVEYDDGTPIKNADIFLGSISKKTDMEGAYGFSNVSRVENQIKIKIKDKELTTTLHMPAIYWKLEKNIKIPLITVGISGEVNDENENPVGESWVNLSGEMEKSDKTDSLGRFDLGEINVPFVPSKPLILSVYLPNEPKPRFRLVLDIPTEEPYDKYPVISLPSKDKVDVKGRVLLLDNYTDRMPEEMPYVIVEMNGRTDQTEENGGYTLTKVPMDTMEYIIKSVDGKTLCNYTIYPALTESPEIPRIRNLTVLKSDLINLS